MNAKILVYRNPLAKARRGLNKIFHQTPEYVQLTGVHEKQCDLQKLIKYND